MLKHCSQLFSRYAATLCCWQVNSIVGYILIIYPDKKLSMKLFGVDESVIIVSRLEVYELELHYTAHTEVIRSPEIEP